MIKIREWDWDLLLKQISLTREYPFQDTVRDSIKIELERLNFYGWNVICQVVENIISYGRSVLFNNLWKTVRDCVDERISSIKNNQVQTKVFTPEHMVIGQGLADINTKTINEMERWLKTDPPLKYKGIAVLYRSSFYPTMNFDLEVWHKKGRQELQSILHDEYMSIYHDSITKEEKEKTNGILTKELSLFLERLYALRSAQIKVRTEQRIVKNELVK